jgi:3-isopropylmalate/(R)-2-methylmalate dehydratase small subunit
VKELFSRVNSKKGYTLTVDLESQSVLGEDGWKTGFDIDPFKKKTLLEGLDDIALTLRNEDEIRAYESVMSKERKWAAPSQA